MRGRMQSAPLQQSSLWGCGSAQACPLGSGGILHVADHLEGVGPIAVHVAVAIRDASVTEEERDLVGGLWTKGDEVPEHIYILEGR